MVSFVVTGFGPFGGVTENPTTTLTAKLIEYLREKEAKEREGGSDIGGAKQQLFSLAASTRVLVMETSAAAARQQIDALYDELVAKRHGKVGSIRGSRSGDDDDAENAVILLHLGVHGSARHFRLETCAYNHAHFSIPDERGYQPCDVPIVAGDVGTALPTLFDVPAIVQQLNSTRCYSGGAGRCGDRIAAVASTDPGLFVCNYTYCYSLDKFQCSRPRRDVERPPSPPKLPNVRCLFLHVPPFAVAPEREQLRFVAHLMRTLAQQVVGPNNRTAVTRSGPSYATA
jgi:pyroglutamyl-peptidase